MSWVITGSEKVTQDPYLYTNTVLLLKGDGTNGSTTILDGSKVAGSPKTVTAVGNAQISTAIADPFGNSTKGVIAFDGDGDRLTCTLASNIGTGDFTLEAWAYINVLTTNRPIIQIGDINNTLGILLYVTSAGRIAIAANLVNAIIGTTQTVSTATWTHLAVTKSAGTIRTFVNGVNDGSVSNSNSFINTVRIGSELFSGTTGTQLNGYLDEIRITTVARYTANFTPPTAPFPDI
jgi:hypothetical protein